MFLVVLCCGGDGCWHFCTGAGEESAGLLSALQGISLFWPGWGLFGGFLRPRTGTPQLQVAAGCICGHHFVQPGAILCYLGAIL